MLRKGASTATGARPFLLSDNARRRDIFSQIIVTVPLYALYELSIVIVGRCERRRDA